jgi:hypothetical protein
MALGTWNVNVSISVRDYAGTRASMSFRLTDDSGGSTGDPVSDALGIIGAVDGMIDPQIVEAHVCFPIDLSTFKQSPVFGSTVSEVGLLRFLSVGPGPNRASYPILGMSPSLFVGDKVNTSDTRIFDGLRFMTVNSGSPPFLSDHYYHALELPYDGIKVFRKFRAAMARST